MATHEGSPCRPVTIFCLHKFPQDHKTKAWLNQVRGVDMPPLENSYVCSEHFCSNENGGKVTLRGVRQAKTGGKMFVQCYKFGRLERKFSLAPRKMANQHTGRGSFLTLLLQAERQQTLRTT